MDFVKKLTPREFWLTAATWGSAMHAGDSGACMYAFDEKGLVQSEEHRQDCITYIETECRKAADANLAAGEDPAGQHPELDALLEYLRSAPVSGRDLGLDELAEAYVTAALWSTNDNADESGGDPLDQNYAAEHIAPETLERMKADCAKFQELYGRLIDEANLSRNGSESAASSAGHDFWLTRCGHGAGFWDGDWEEPAATTLTDAAKSFGDFDLYVGDDGFIHGSGGNPAPEPIEGVALPPSA